MSTNEQGLKISIYLREIIDYSDRKHREALAAEAAVVSRGPVPDHNKKTTNFWKRLGVISRILLDMFAELAPEFMDDAGNFVAPSLRNPFNLGKVIKIVRAAIRAMNQVSSAAKIAETEKLTEWN